MHPAGQDLAYVTIIKLNNYMYGNKIDEGVKLIMDNNNLIQTV